MQNAQIWTQNNYVRICIEAQFRVESCGISCGQTCPHVWNIVRNHGHASTVADAKKPLKSTFLRVRVEFRVDRILVLARIERMTQAEHKKRAPAAERLQKIRGCSVWRLGRGRSRRYYSTKARTGKTIRKRPRHITEGTRQSPASIMP